MRIKSLADGVINGGLEEEEGFPLWQPFLDIMAFQSGNSGETGRDTDSLAFNLDLFSSLSVVRSVSLFLLNEETFEFNHHVSCPVEDEPGARLDFSFLVDQRVMASALNSDQGYFNHSCAKGSDERHWLILPLKALKEIGGIILLSLNRPVHSWEQTLLPLCLLQARQVAYLIQNKVLKRKLKNHEAFLRQKISGRTQNLEHAKRELKTILDSIKTGILIIDQDTHLVMNANKSALEIMGYTKEDILGTPCHTLCLKENEKCPFSGLGSDGGLDNREYLLNKSNGETIPVLKTVVSAFLRGRSCLIESFVDITERKHLEKQFHQSQKLEAIGRLAGGVAHDFNNLLMAIIGYCDLTLAGMEKATHSYRYVEEISKAADRAASLTHQLLALSRRQMMQPRILDLNAVISEIKTMLRRVIGEDIELITCLDPELAPIKADKGQLEQVIMNLTINARDAMPHGGKLTFQTSNVELDESSHHRNPIIAPGFYTLLTVSDNGEGMDKETQSHIFEPFFTTKGVGKGTGLGLSTVYGIVKQSEGYIWVHSELGEGTTVEIFLPCASDPFKKPERTSEPLPSPQGSETILLVEDESMLRTSIREGLETNGYHVLEASNGDKAILISRRYSDPIHLVLTDVVMPGMNGRMVAEALALIHPEARILYMSGYTDDAVIRNSLFDEKTAFLQKPFTPRELACKVREILDQPKT
jgi:two-component system cell cycle sensor histidine kinase/response regulator CckA